MSVTATDAAIPTDGPAQLLDALVGDLVRIGAIKTPTIEAAFRAVPRHVFAPTAELDAAYANDSVPLKRNDDGQLISTLSQPEIMAGLLELLDVQPGHRILEIGLGGGHMAAILGKLTGPTGRVVSIDIDADLVDAATRSLNLIGADNVRPLHGDGGLGAPEYGPYDRVLATVGLADVPPALLDQVAEGGVIVVPLRIRGDYTRAIEFARDGTAWRSRGHILCGFVPMRGVESDDRQHVDPTGDGSVLLDIRTDHHLDVDSLAGVFDQPGVERWTRVYFVNCEPFEWMWLWLTTTVAGLVRFSTPDPNRRPHGFDQFQWGAIGVAGPASVAFITHRRIESAADAGLVELGVIGHGPYAQILTDQLTTAIQGWDRMGRDRRATFTLYPRDYRAPTAEVVVDKQHHRLAIGWYTPAIPQRPARAGHDVLQGVLIAESLRPSAVLDSALTVASVRRIVVSTPAPGQPPVWTMLAFTIEADRAAGLAAHLRAALKPGPWYADFGSSEQRYIVYADAAFHYTADQPDGREAAASYGRIQGIPDAQLDWPSLGAEMASPAWEGR